MGIANDDKISQNNLVRIHLQTFGTITSLEAIDYYKITRLSQRVRDLRSQGFTVTSQLEYDPVNKSRHWSVYTLIKPQSN